MRPGLSFAVGEGLLVFAGVAAMLGEGAGEPVAAVEGGVGAEEKGAASEVGVEYCRQGLF